MEVASATAASAERASSYRGAAWKLAEVIKRQDARLGREGRGGTKKHVVAEWSSSLEATDPGAAWDHATCGSWRWLALTRRLWEGGASGSPRSRFSGQ